MKQTIRIIGGQYRGKKLQFPVAEGLRPTPDRVRETLFNWLMNDIRDAHCLDAFAGSGALGFEAHSRGAANVTLLEKNPDVFANLLKTAASFHSPQLTLKKVDACEFLLETNEHFNIVFLDPPFSKNYLPECLEALAHSDVLVENGLLYLESPHQIAVDHSHWEQLKLKGAGQIIYGLYRKHHKK